MEDGASRGTAWRRVLAGAAAWVEGRHCVGQKGENTVRGKREVRADPLNPPWRRR